MNITPKRNSSRKISNDLLRNEKDLIRLKLEEAQREMKFHLDRINASKTEMMPKNLFMEKLLCSYPEAIRDIPGDELNFLNPQNKENNENSDEDAPRKNIVDAVLKATKGKENAFKKFAPNEMVQVPKPDDFIGVFVPMGKINETKNILANFPRLECSFFEYSSSNLDECMFKEHIANSGILKFIFTSDAENEAAIKNIVLADENVDAKLFCFVSAFSTKYEQLLWQATGLIGGNVTGVFRLNEASIPKKE